MKNQRESGGEIRPKNAFTGGKRSSQFATVLSSDSIGPEEYCALAYEDSDELNPGSGRGDTYAAQRLPARKKSPSRM